eukprot:m.10002 g.10002  ORF g.10002 m.10002 type:complete len:136 (-) comp8055_c0_seq2:78-485(-)
MRKKSVKTPVLHTPSSSILVILHTGGNTMSGSGFEHASGKTVNNAGVRKPTVVGGGFGNSNKSRMSRIKPTLFERAVTGIKSDPRTVVFIGISGSMMLGLLGYQMYSQWEEQRSTDPALPKVVRVKPEKIRNGWD